MILTQKHKTLAIASITLMLLFLGLDFLIPKALAVTVSGNNYTQEIAEKLTIFHQFFSPLINLFATHIGNLLGNDYIFAGAMGEMLKNLWVISRNIVNIFFVGALLWVALKAVVGEFFGEEVDVKKELLKIAVFLVVVNFSWLVTKVVLDAANVATNVVFSLPSGVSNVSTIDLGKCSIDANTGKVTNCKPTDLFNVTTATKPGDIINLTHQECKDQKIKEAYNDVYPPPDKNYNQSAKPENIAKVKDKSVRCWAHMDLFDYDQNSAVIYLTYGMAGIQNLGGSHANGLDFAKMALASLFSLLIEITYTIALLALFILMVVRMAMLWLFVGFSPVLVVMLYLGGGEGPVSNFGPKDFIKWAFVPAYTGAILSAGFIMIAAGQANSEILTNLNQNVNLTTGFYDPIAIFSGIDTIFNLVWLIVIELVFAIAVYAPMKEMPFAGTIIGPIADFAKTTLTSLAKTPLLAPIIPVTNTTGTGKDRVSLRDLARGFQSKIEWREGAASDTRTIIKLEEQAKDLRISIERDKAIETSILSDLRRNRLDTLNNKLPNFNDLRTIDDDQKETTLKLAFSYTGSKIGQPEIDDMVRLLNQKGSAPTAAPPAGLVNPIPGAAPAAGSTGGATGGPAAPNAPTAGTNP